MDFENFDRFYTQIEKQFNLGRKLEQYFKKRVMEQKVLLPWGGFNNSNHQINRRYQREEKEFFISSPLCFLLFYVRILGHFSSLWISLQLFWSLLKEGDRKGKVEQERKRRRVSHKLQQHCAPREPRRANCRLSPSLYWRISSNLATYSSKLTNML